MPYANSCTAGFYLNRFFSCAVIALLSSNVVESYCPIAQEKSRRRSQMAVETSFQWNTLVCTGASYMRLQPRMHVPGWTLVLSARSFCRASGGSYLRLHQPSYFRMETL